jgi:hypothetical protein
LRDWHERDNSQGLVVIGNHYPEFSYEAEIGNVEEALERLNVPYPVALDNQGLTWDAYDIHYWPTLVLIDKRGRIPYQHIGEGRYEEIERAILTLMAEQVLEE